MAMLKDALSSWLLSLAAQSKKTKKEDRGVLYLMVMSKDALSSWLLSLAKLTQVTPLVWAFSNLRRH